MRLLTLAGIPVRLHGSFGLVVVGWAALVAAAPHTFVRTTVLGAVLFASVVLHELGHALVARHHGVTTREILLFPLGGMAVMEGARLRPAADLAISVAGPAVNLVLGAALLVPAMLSQGTLLGQIAGINLLLGTLNLLPAYPMDGGRVLRALVARWFGYRVAQQVALGTGALAAVLALIASWRFHSTAPALLGGFMLVVLFREARQLHRLGLLGAPER